MKLQNIDFGGGIISRGIRTMKKMILGISILGIISQLVKASIKGIRTNIVLSEMHLDTLVGTLLLTIVAVAILHIFKLTETKKSNALIIGSLFGIYKGVSLGSKSMGGIFNIMILYTSINTLILAFSIMALGSILSIHSEKKKIDKKELC